MVSTQGTGWNLYQWRDGGKLVGKKPSCGVWKGKAGIRCSDSGGRKNVRWRPFPTDFVATPQDFERGVSGVQTSDNLHYVNYNTACWLKPRFV